MFPSMAMIGVLAAKKAYNAFTRVPISGVALVTGGAGGIGFILCQELIRRGAKAVVVVDLDQKVVDEAVARLSLFATDARVTVQVKGYACNVSDADQVKRMAEKVRADVGDVDILVNNAGIVSGKTLLQLTEDQIRRTFAVNTLAHFWTIRSFLPQMKKRNRGMIVTISSAGGIVGTNGLADYSASKFAVYGMDEALRLELRGTQVHTLCVTPYFINTGLFDGVKTKIPFLLPILEPNYVARRIADAMEARQYYLEIPSILQLAWLTKVLPTRLRDRILDTLGVTSSMSEFKGRSKL